MCTTMQAVGRQLGLTGGVQYEVIGGNMQGIRFTLRPGETLIGEAGCMLFMDEGIEFECRSSNGSVMQQDNSWWGAIKAGVKRVVTNESLFYTWFTNRSNVPRVMAVAAPTMGTFVTLDLHQLPEKTVFAQAGSFVCSSPGVVFSIELVKNFGAGMFGREGFILQRMHAEPNSTGHLFLHGGGTIVRKELQNEELTVDAGCLMAFTPGIDYDIGFPGLGNAVISGKLFMAKLRGTGSVWIQSTPRNKVIDLIVAAVPEQSEGNN